VRTGSGTLDPARLCWGLLEVARRLGVRLHEGSAVTGIENARPGLVVRTAAGKVRADKAILATNAFPPLLRRLRSFILPVLDHVLVTEPLSSEQREAIGWRAEQVLTDAGNQFHYYRLTPDGRILFGGYDATYHYGGATPDGVPARKESYRRLSAHFHDTFPQLEGLRFSHRWFGVIDTTSRFTPIFGTAHDGRVAYAVGYTGLGVGSSRFGAKVALDLVDGLRTERTSLKLVSRVPVPFPPEPLRYPIVRMTKAALAREDRTGRRGAFLGLLDRFGVGFNS
jgi:glycine/D-amino acid oxidase-like deaminating enzyme